MSRIRFAAHKFQAIDCGSDSIVYSKINKLIIDLGNQKNEVVTIVANAAINVITQKLIHIVDCELLNREDEISTWFLKYPPLVREKRRVLKEQRGYEIKYKNQYLNLLLDIEKERELLLGIQLVNLVKSSSKFYVFTLPTKLEHGLEFAILKMLQKVNKYIDSKSLELALTEAKIYYTNNEFIDALCFVIEKGLVQKQNTLFILSDLGKVFLSY